MSAPQRFDANELLTVVNDAALAVANRGPGAVKPWQVLIVDDEPEVHRATEFALEGFGINGRGVEFLHAYSGKEARQTVAAHPDIAVIFLDVVMETEDAGLALVRYIRRELRMGAVRIVLRTGQPGYAPEMQIIRDYDINDYKTKAELTRTRLATTLTTALRSYEQIRAIDVSRRGLGKIVNAAADLYARRGVESFCDGVLTQISGLLGVEPEGLVCAQRGSPFDSPSEELYVVGAAGRYRAFIEKPLNELADEHVVKAVRRTIKQRGNLFEHGHTTLFFRDHTDREVAVFLDTQEPVSEIDQRLIEVFCANISIGFENVALFEKLHAYAYYDQLCGLPNRIKFVNTIDERIFRQRDGLLVGIVDIDHFSETNDALGHENGDLLLKSIATRLKGALSAQVTVARVAGDAFGIFGPESEIDPEHVVGLFDSPFAVNGYALQVSASLGLVRLGESQGTGLDALKNANIGLKRAKSRQRGRFYYYAPEMEVSTRERVKLCHDLRVCIEKQKLKIYYQPQIDLASGMPVGAEALLRWQTPDGSFIPPDKFIPIAEYSGMIRPLGEWVLRTASRQLRMWNEQGLRDFRMAVNVSMSQFRATGFTDMAAAVIKEFGIDPGCLELEITESMAMEDVEIVIATLKRLKDIGVTVAIDDFGTGFSSLGYLQKLDVDRLKIDRAFVNDLVCATQRTSIPDMIIKLGHSLDLQVIAEGVETAEQAEQLKLLGCDEAQGYFFCKPGDSKSFDAWMMSQGMLKAPTAV